MGYQEHIQIKKWPYKLNDRDVQYCEGRCKTIFLTGPKPFSDKIRMEPCPICGGQMLWASSSFQPEPIEDKPKLCGECGQPLPKCKDGC